MSMVAFLFFAGVLSIYKAVLAISLLLLHSLVFFPSKIDIL